MPSAVELCNQALIVIGEPPIVSLTDTDRRSRVCNTFYAQKRDALLRSYRWKFAIKRLGNIAASGTAPVAQFPFAYPLPEDCLRVLAVNDDVAPEHVHNRDALQWDIEGRTIVSYFGGPIHLKYISRVSDENQFDISFSESFVLYLARYLFPALKDSDPARTDRFEAAFTRSIQQARFLNSIERDPVYNPQSYSRWAR